MRTPEEIGESLKLIVYGMNEISLEDIDGMRQEVSRSEAIEPMIDPTAWSRGNMFKVSNQTKRVLQAVRDFKVEVSGIGSFVEVNDAKTK